MPKLNQIIAIREGKTGRAEKALTEAHRKLEKTELLMGISRTYAPIDENGDQLPPEAKKIQYSVPEAIGSASEALTELFDIVLHYCPAISRTMSTG